MKKRIVLVLLLLCTLLVAGVYFFIPATLRISSVAVVRAHPAAVNRFLADGRRWKHWRPGTEQAGNAISFHPVGHMPDRIAVAVWQGQFQANSFIQIIPFGQDSAALEWTSTHDGGFLPWRRWANYRRALRLKKSMQLVLRNMKSFLEKPEHVYGRRIREERVRDTLLIALKSVSPGYPSTFFIYELIGRLEKYAAAHSASATNFPMLHIAPLENGAYETYVALPVNKALPGNGTFLFKRMVPGNILVADVQGGPRTIDSAFREMENYKADYQRLSPAIPFQSLVTDRRLQPDTSQWITRIYYPVY